LKDIKEPIFSNVVQNDVTVCGNEKIEVKDKSPFVKKFESDGDSETATIEFSTVESWF
jgi:hypothetical protein